MEICKIIWLMKLENVKLLRRKDSISCLELIGLQSKDKGKWMFDTWTHINCIYKKMSKIYKMCPKVKKTTLTNWISTKTYAAVELLLQPSSPSDTKHAKGVSLWGWWLWDIREGESESFWRWCKRKWWIFLDHGISKSWATGEGMGICTEGKDAGEHLAQRSLTHLGGF